MSSGPDSDRPPSGPDDSRTVPPPLERDLVDLCALVSEAIDSSTEALIQAQPRHAEAAVHGNARAAALADRCEQRALGLLTHTDRTADAVRRIITAREAAADLRRMTALAERIADIAGHSRTGGGVPAEVEGHIAEMGRTCATLTDLAREILASGSPQRARGLQTEHDAMDRLHRHLMTVLLDHEWSHGVPSAVESALIGRHYDRFGAHAARVVRAADALTRSGADGGTADGAAPTSTPPGAQSPQP